MRKRVLISILFIMLLIAFGGTVSHAAISKPKNFRIVYVSEEGKELELHCAKTGESMNAFIKRAISAQVEADNAPVRLL